MHKSYKLYKKCDDGAIAEGYSESVARILVDHWSTLDRLAALAKTDLQFRHFTIKHIDATLNINDVKKIGENATNECPKDLSVLCGDIKKAANLSLEDSSAVK